MEDEITRVLVRVQIVEIVALLTELNAGGASTELLHQETVVSLHDLPNQLSWNRRHFTYLRTMDRDQIVAKQKWGIGENEFKIIEN